LYYKIQTLSLSPAVISPWRILRLFFCRSLNCLPHQVNNSVAFIVSGIDFPLLRWIINAHFQRLSLTAFHPHTLWQGLSSRFSANIIELCGLG
jgi:hypothetical protein